MSAFSGKCVEGSASFFVSSTMFASVCEIFSVMCIANG